MVFFNLGSEKSSTNVPYTKNQKRNKECDKKDFLGGSKKNKFVLEEVTLTVTRSRRISRRPSNWWVVKSEQSKYFHLNYVHWEPPKNRSVRRFILIDTLILQRKSIENKLNWVINGNIKSVNFKDTH